MLDCDWILRNGTPICPVRQKITKKLCTFLRNQKDLESLDISNCYMSAELGIGVLSMASRNSRLKTLEMLYMFNESDANVMKHTASLSR